MLLVMNKNATTKQIDAVIAAIKEQGGTLCVPTRTEKGFQSEAFTIKGLLTVLFTCCPAQFVI